MYIIECRPIGGGAPRYVANKPLGNDVLKYAYNPANAYKFEELSTAQVYRDDALAHHESADIIGGIAK